MIKYYVCGAYVSLFTMPICFIPSRILLPAKSSPTTETNLTRVPPVLKAASATLRPTPPKVCFTLPGVEVCNIEAFE